jgi:hypothetical protein
VEGDHQGSMAAGKADRAVHTDGVGCIGQDHRGQEGGDLSD